MFHYLQHSKAEFVSEQLKPTKGGNTVCSFPVDTTTYFQNQSNWILDFAQWELSDRKAQSLLFFSLRTKRKSRPVMEECLALKRPREQAFKAALQLGDNN